MLTTNKSIAEKPTIFEKNLLDLFGFFQNFDTSFEL